MKVKVKKLANPNFKKWFGQSKVVDDAGNPLIVYHGTEKDFDLFSKDVEKGGFSEKGFFFTSSPLVASTYATREGANILPVYLRIINPLIVDADFGSFRRFIPKEKPTKYRYITSEIDLKFEKAYYNPYVLRNIKTGSTVFSFATKSEALKKLQEIQKNKFVELDENYEGIESVNSYIRKAIDGGYDGLIIYNISDIGGEIETRTKEEYATTYVVFEPSQIKSAIGNMGTFNTKTTDIVMKHGGEILQSTGNVLLDTIFAFPL